MFSLSQDIRTKLEKLSSKIGRPLRILDLGCGIINHTKDILNSDICMKYTAVDAHKPYLDLIEENSKLIKINLEALEYLNINEGYLDYDVILALDVLEHFEKEDAYLFIEKMFDSGALLIYIFTTEGFQEQNDGHGWGSNNEKWQKHRCGFTYDEMVYEMFKVERVKAPYDALVCTNSI